MKIIKAALLAALLTILAAGAFAQGAGSTINLRDYWILAEIVNLSTGARADFRVDCSDQSPLSCEGGDGRGELGSAVQRRRDQQRLGQADEGAWPQFIWAELNPFFPGIVGYAASGAGGFAVSNEKWLVNLITKPASFDELRSADGFSIRISTVRGGERLDDSDIRLTMRLVTPTELAIRDAAAKAKKTPAGKPAAEDPAPGLLDRLRKLF